MEQKKIDLVGSFYSIIKDNEESTDKWWRDFYADKQKTKKLTVRRLKDCCGRGAKTISSYQYRIPEREDVLVLACLWQLGVDKTNEVLLRAGYNALYARSIDDAIYIYMLNTKNDQVSKDLVEHYRVLIKDKLSYADHSVLDGDKYKNWEKVLAEYKIMMQTTDEEIRESCGIPHKTKGKPTDIIPERDTIISMSACAGYGAETANILLVTYGHASLNKAVKDDAIWLYILGKGVKMKAECEKYKTPKADFDKYKKELEAPVFSRFYEALKIVTGLEDNHIALECGVAKDELYSELPDRDVLIMICAMAGFDLENTNEILSRGWNVTSRTERDNKHRRHKRILTGDKADLCDGVWRYILERGSACPKKDFTVVRELVTCQSWGEFYNGCMEFLMYTDDEIAEILGLTDVQARGIMRDIPPERETVIMLAALAGFNSAMTKALISSKGYKNQLGESMSDSIWKYMLEKGGSDKPGRDYSVYEAAQKQGKPLTKRTFGTRIADQVLANMNADAEDFIKTMRELEKIHEGAYDRLVVEIQNIWEEIISKKPTDAFKTMHGRNLENLKKHQPPERMYLLALSIYGNLNLVQTNDLLEKARMEKLRVRSVKDFESWLYLAHVYFGVRYPLCFDEQEINDDDEARIYQHRIIEYMGEIIPTELEEVFFIRWVNMLLSKLENYGAASINEAIKLL